MQSRERLARKLSSEKKKQERMSHLDPLEELK
jgi:hypothetical protein